MVSDIEDKMRDTAPQLRSLNARVKFNFGDDGMLFVDATTSPVAITTADQEADCTIRISADNMRKMLAGKLDPMLAFTFGKLKVEGSKGIAMKLSALLGD
jgi:putative sterol carrier protein